MKLVRTFALVTAVVACAALAATPALAQEQPAGPGSEKGADPVAPAAPAKPAEPAKKERKVDAKAMEVCEAYAKQVHSPARAGVKEMSCSIEMPMAQLGGDALTLKPHIKDGVYTCEVELPESLLAMIPPEQVDMMKKMLGGQLGTLARRFLDEPVPDMSAYDVALSEQGGKPVVVLTPFSDKADSEKQKLVFGTDGLLEKTIITPKIDMNDPQAAMMAGSDIEAVLKHAKMGDQFVISDVSVTTPMGEMTMKASYFEGPKGLPLAKALEMTSTMSPEPMTLSFFDYALDGKKVEGTEKGKMTAKTPETPKAPEAPKTPEAPKAPDAPQGPEAPK